MSVDFSINSRNLSSRIPTRSEYDRGANTNSPERRQQQIEHSIRAIKLGSTAIGICISKGKEISCRMNADCHSLVHAQQGSKNKALDAIEKDLSNFESPFKQDPKLRDIILDPTIKHSVKAATLKDVSDRIR